MKRTLLLLKSNLLKRIYAIPAVFLLLALLSMSTAARAQVVYSMGDPASGSSLPGDVVYRMNYDGSGSATITTGANAGLVQPGQIALDGNNNRLFVSEIYLSGNVIKVLNATTGAVIRTITSANSAYIKAIEYDVVNDWLYYTTEGGDVTVLTSTDALFRVHADGTGSQTLATTLTKNPFKIDIDVAGNKVYVLDVTFSGRSIKTIDLANGNAVTSRGFATSLNSIYDFAIDKVNGYIYYLAEGGNVLTLTATDALRRQNLDGTGDVALITSIANSPYRLALDLGNNRAYVTDSYNVTAKIIAVNLSNNTFSTALNLPTGTSAPLLADIAVPEQPKVTTTAASSVLSTSATLAGNLVYGYGLNTERGVVYSSTNTTPTISDSKASMATNTSNGAYSASVTGLSPSTTYYARAYAVNGAGTTYGAVVTFSTSSNDANLSGLSISAGTLTPSFSAGTTSYTASVAGANSTITVTPTKNNANASIKVNTVAVNSGSASGAISLNTGDNTITTVVTAQDGTTTKTYTLTVNRAKASQTITFNALPAKNYGNADFAPGATASSGLGISYSSDNTSVATIVGGNIHIVSTGTANITATQAGDANNTAATNVTQSLTIGNAAITVTANAASKIYGDADPSLTYSITTGALVGSDAFSGSLTRDAGVNAGTYAINQGTLTLGSKYTLTFVSGVLSINKRPISIQPAPASKIYGDADPGGYPYFFRVGSLAAGDGMTGSFTRAPGEIPGTYVLSLGNKRPVNATLGTEQINNYDLTFIPENLTISKRVITLQPAPATKVYGNVDPGFPYYFRVGSVAPGEGMTGTFGRQPGEDVGTYTLNLGTKRPVNATTGVFTDQYYDISFLPDNLTITKRTVNVSANAQNKTYGDADPTLTYAADALGFSDTFNGTLTRVAGEGAGTYPISQGTLALNANNYNLNFTGSNLTIDKKIINVTANAQTKTYGDPEPALTYTADALANGESFTGGLIRDAGEGFGTYAINQGSLALNSNYTLNYTGANLNIGKKAINVTANAQTKAYGTADPAFTYNADALISGDAFTGTLSRDAGEDAGNHVITQGTLALNNNYTVNYTGADLSIGKGTLTYTATPVSRFFQVANPIFTGTVTGFVNSETQTSATTGTLSFTSTTTASSPAGSYAINGEGLSATNYNFIQDAANSTALTITLSGDATLAALTVDQGTLSPAFSSSQENYGVGVDNSVTSFNLSLTLGSPYASIMVNGQPFTSGSTQSFSLTAGPNNFNIAVTAQDGTIKGYSVSVFRAYDTNNLLASLSLSGITFIPVFNTNTLNYTATVGNEVSSTNVNAAAVASTANVFVNGNNLAQTGPVNFPLQVGETGVQIVSKAENGAERIYTVTVTRAKSPDATLASFGNSDITLNTPFVNSTHTYSAAVANGVGALTFRPTATSDRAVIKVNGNDTNPFSGNNVNLAFGNNAITFDVTSEDGANHITYNLNVYRLRSSDATLSSLSFPFITSLNESFDPAVFDYTATVADSTYTGIPLSAIAASENAIVKIDGTVVPRFINYTLPVHGGPNTYKIVVTSQDTSATKTYTLVLTRAGTPPPLQSPVANLASLTISSGSSFSKNFNFSFEPLTTVTAPNSVTSVRIFPNSENAVSTVTVNGIIVPHDNTTDLLPISVGDNLFTILVTAEDGVHTKTYSLHINRLPFVDVSLASLTISNGTLAPVFNPGTRTYTVTVPNNVSTMDVTPVATVNTSTIKIGATTIDASNPTATVNLFTGPPNRIRVVILAADGVTTQTYTINVTRQLSTVATLSSVKLSTPSTLVLTTGPADYNYTTSVSVNTSTVRIIAASTDPGATIRVNDIIVASGSTSDEIPLIGSATVINTVITAQDGVTTKTYAITVHKGGSSNAILSSLTFSTNTTRVATTGPANYNYITSVDPEVTSLTLTPTASEPGTVIRVNGVIVTSATVSGAIDVSASSTVINILVTAPDGVSTKTYAVTVIKLGSNNAGLASVKLNPASVLTKVTGTTDGDYTTSVNNSTASVKLTPNASDARALIKVNGATVVSGTESGDIALNESGPTVITLQITAHDGVTVKNYTVTVSRTGSNNALLSAITFSTNTTKTLSTGPANYNYVTSVDPATTSLTLTPTANDGNATILVNGASITSGTASGTITLTGSSTVINLLVTAQDGITTKTYQVTVNKTGSNNANLIAFNLSPSSPLTKTGASNTSYTTLVDYNTATLKVIVTAADPNATIKVNGATVTSGVLSGPISLNAGMVPTDINMVVTAQDGVTTNIYTITVNKTGSHVASLKSIKLSPSSAFTKTTGPANINFITTASASTSSVKLIAVTNDANSTFKVNGVSVASGVASGAIALTSDTTMINVVVTAQDGVTKLSYSVGVVKTAAIPFALVSKTNDEKAPEDKPEATEVIVHQGVSPNGDGINDYLTIDGLTNTDNQLSIMNGSGILVFETKGYGSSGNVFDGHSNKNGSLQNAGTYFYSLDYKDGDTNKHKTGYIILKY